MADHSVLSQLVKIGLEAAAGGGGPANRRVTNLQIELAPQGDFAEYRGAGHKYVDSVVPGDEWASGNSSGPLGFAESIFPFASIVDKPTPTGPGGDGQYTWTFNSNPAGPDSVATYVVEKGDGTSNFRWTYVYFNELTVKANRKEASFTGTVMGQTMSAGITPTPETYPNAWVTVHTYALGDVVHAVAGHTTVYFEATDIGSAPHHSGVSEPTWSDVLGATVVDGDITWTTRYRVTTIENVLLVPQRFDLFYADTFAHLNSTTPGDRHQMLRGFDWEFKLGNRFSSFFPMISSLTSYAGIVEQAVDATLSLQVGMDTTGGDFVAPLTLATERAGTPLFFRLQANGPTIAGMTTYHFHMDVCAVVNQPLKWQDQNGLVVNGWDMRVVNDPVAGMPFQIELINTTSRI